MTLVSTPALTASSTITKCGGGTLNILSIVHPTSGGQAAQDTPKGTASAPLGCAAGRTQTFTISGSGGPAYHGTRTGTNGTPPNPKQVSFLKQGGGNAPP